MKGGGTFSIHFLLVLVASPPWRTVGGHGYVEIGYDCAEGTTCHGFQNFCAEDGVCHPRTCETIYQYASESIRGNRPTSTGIGEQEIEPQEDQELECYVNEFPPNNVVEPPCPRDEDGGGLFPIAVYYTCRDYYGPRPPSEFRCWDWYDAVHHHSAAGLTTTTTATPQPPRFAATNRVCTAKPNPEQRFICYDIAPDTDLVSYFDDYLEAVESIGGCDDDNGSMNDTTDNDDMMTNSTAALGHVVVTVNRYVDGSSVILNDASLYQNGTFEPFLVAGLSISTILMDDPQPDTAVTSPSTSSPPLTGVVSRILTAIICSVSMMVRIIVE